MVDMTDPFRYLGCRINLSYVHSCMEKYDDALTRLPEECHTEGDKHIK